MSLSTVSCSCSSPWCHAHSLARHAESVSCACMLCAFKRHFSGFWSNADSVSIMDALDFNRSATEYSFEVNEHDSVDLWNNGGGEARQEGLFDNEETQDPLISSSDYHGIVPDSLVSATPAPKTKGRPRTVSLKAAVVPRTVSLKALVQPLLSTPLAAAPLAAAPLAAFHPVNPHSQPAASVTEQSLGGEFSHLYPHVTRVFDSDSDAFASIKWSLCTSTNLWDICTSSHLISGSSKSMAWYLQFAIKCLLGDLKPFITDRYVGTMTMLTQGTRGITKTQSLNTAFLDCVNCPGVLTALCSRLSAYNAQKQYVIRFKPFVFPEVSPVLVDTLRVASMMVDPACIDLFGRLSNPVQDRSGSDFPEMRIVAVRQRLLEEIAHDFFNNVDYCPAKNPDISAWTNMDLDVSRPHETRSWIWVSCLLHCWCDCLFIY